MSRFAPFFGLLLLWLLMPGVISAQVSPYLRVDSVKLQQARSTEQEAILKNDSTLLAEAWYVYGKTYISAGDYRTSQLYFLKALRILVSRGDSPELSRLYYRLSEAERRKENLSGAMRYARLALDVAQRTQSDLALTRAYQGLGIVYEHYWIARGGGSQAEASLIVNCYREVERLCHKTKDTLGIAEASNNIGRFFVRTGNPLAITYLKKALYLFTLRKAVLTQASATIELARAYLKIDQFKQAEQSLLEADKLFQVYQLNNFDSRTSLENTFVAYYEQVGQWQEALDHYKKLSTLQTSQLIADRNGAVARLNIEYETEKKEAQLRIQTSELTNLRVQQRFFVIIAVLLLITAGLSVVFFRLYRKTQRVSRQNEELIKEQNHRVKNNLQVVSSLLSLQSKRLTDHGARKAIEESRLRVQSMAILHQKLYDGSQLAAVDLDEFIPELVSNVLNTYGYPTISPELVIDPIVLSADKAVPLGLILNELTTNACKYAFSSTVTPCYFITCSCNEQVIALTVRDNGPGMSKQTSTKSFGLQLIQAQVEQLRGTYLFRSESGEVNKGTTFTLTFDH